MPRIIDNITKNKWYKKITFLENVKKIKNILIKIISRHVCINVFSFYLDPKINSM